jgi:septum formation protein
VPDVDESVRDGEPADEYVVRLAKEKANVVADRWPGWLVLAADTTVVVDGEIVGKPEDEADARRMINLLSGSWHEVLTGVAVVDGEVRSGLEQTRVKFAEMSPQEVEFLVREGSPLDKAGAYAVQAQAALFIERIEGDYWNVVGLPVQLVYRLVAGDQK